MICAVCGEKKENNKERKRETKILTHFKRTDI
jgi:hypothetical protein